MNSGIYDLGSREISAALTDEIVTEGVAESGVAQAFIGALAGMQSATIFVNFDYGSGGTAVVVVVQTSIDQGQNWIDVARFDFATADSKKHATVGVFSGASPAAVAALGAEGKLDNILGDRLRAKVTSTGTYAGSQVTVRAAVR